MARRDLSTPLAASKFDQNDPKKKKKKLTKKQVRKARNTAPKPMTPKSTSAKDLKDAVGLYEYKKEKEESVGRKFYTDGSVKPDMKSLNKGSKTLKSYPKKKKEKGLRYSKSRK
jgi:hypothetical protein